MPKLRPGLMVAALLVAATTGLSSQQQPPPVFRAGIQYVPVDVVVTDSNDKPITDLEAFDFEILDRGKPQRIVDFRLVTIPVGTPGTTVVTRTSDVASNATPSPNSRLFVVMIDDLHTLEYELIQVKQIATEFIQSLAPTDEVALVFVGRSDLGINFTNDRARLLQAIDRTREAMGMGIDALGRSGNGAGARNVAQSYGRALASTLSSTAMAIEGSSHARRAIVYIGAGTPLDPNAGMRGDERQIAETVHEELKAAYDKARRANVPIYTIDPRGLVQPADAVRGGIGMSAERAPLGSDVPLRIRLQLENLAVTAINTGGRAFTNQSSLSNAVNAIVADNSSFYVMGFNASHGADTFYRRLEVKVHREGARVRARTGYAFARTTAADATVGERLGLAMTSGVDVRGLGLRAAVAPLLPTTKGMRSAVTIEVAYPAATMAGETTDTLGVEILALDGDGKVKARVARAYTVRPPGSALETFPVVINDVIDLPDRPLTLRVGVASRALGRAGTVQIPVDAPKTSESTIQMGAVVLGLAGGAGPPSLGDDFVKAIVPFQPTTSRTFVPGQTLRVFAPVFWRTRETEARVVLTLEGPSVTLRREERLGVATATDGRRLSAVDTLIPLAQLSGAYTLRLEANVNDKQTFVREVRFEVR
jgi:VWFA-related protein